MKILLIHVKHRPVGGADKVYFNTGDILTHKGHSVIYFSYKSSDNIHCDQEKYFVDAPSKLKSLLHNFYNKQASQKIEDLILDEKPDIAHLHSFWGGLTPSILKVLKKYQVPVIHTIHDYNLICPVTTSIDNRGNICEACQGKYFYKCIIKRCFKGSFIKSFILASGLAFRRKFFDPAALIDGIIYPSIFVHNKHLQYMPELEKCSSIILYNFSPTNPLLRTCQLKRKYFLYLGRLSYEKGLMTLINAFIKLKNINLVITGTGPMEQQLKNIIKNFGANNVEFTGFKTGNELKTIVEEAYFNIVPSEWWENNPLSIIESYSSGIPVIGANIGGIPEIIVEGKTGYLFEMKNIEHLADVILKANSLSDYEYRTMSENAVHFAVEKFNKDQNVKSLIGFYEQIIQNNQNKINCL